jgi:hypothetical protein
MFMHLGGPYDGIEMPVPVDENDEPAEFYSASDFTSPNPGIPSFAGHQSKLVKNTYERNERLGEDGFEYVFNFVGTDTINQNNSRAA